MSTTASGWAVVALSSVPAIQLFGLIMCFSGSYSAMAVFWANAAQLLSRQSQVVGIALISSVGTMASIVSPSIIGVLRDLTDNFAAGIWYSAGLLVFGVLLLGGVARARARTAQGA
jgi:ACS family 4-hydroxyphenylacetate permease-like MFS transporter